jgi:hypothetical protein
MTSQKIRENQIVLVLLFLFVAAISAISSLFNSGLEMLTLAFALGMVGFAIEINRLNWLLSKK